jgi:lipopolysaccharide biosynthesis protein
MTISKINLLQRANLLFRNNEIERSIEYYYMALQEMPQLNEIIEFNISFAKKKIYSIKSHELGEVIQNPRAEKSLVEEICPSVLEKDILRKIINSNLFDSQWYENKYKSQIKENINFLTHYLTTGYKLGFIPSLQFDANFYLKKYPDILAAGINPLVHYVTQGIHEQREIKSPIYNAKYRVTESKYLPSLANKDLNPTKFIRAIAFYLPQFHAIPENDQWWGNGFTEWSKVKPAQPQFKGHYQPHVPDQSLGYYNLLDSKIQTRQIEIAKQYGLEGFCFYVYWFSGKRLLEQPVDNYLKDHSLNFPFCVCWANENWSRRWDGLENEILIKQNYSDEDALNFIHNISKYLRDPRYIKVNGKPLLLIYRPSLFPDMKATSELWRVWCKDNGIGEIYLTYPQSFDTLDPKEYGFDAACEFPPNNSSPPDVSSEMDYGDNFHEGNVYDWRVFVDRSEVYSDSGYTLFRSVTPSWDNTARKNKKGTVFINSSPELFGQWLVNAFIDTKNLAKTTDEQIVFINAWNEWAEGAHLEPDLQNGYAWLRELNFAHSTARKIVETKIAIVVHAFYEDVFCEIMIKIKKLRVRNIKLFVTTSTGTFENINRILINSGINFDIMECENRGRDVLPLLKILNIIIKQNYKFVLKIHTKKSTHRTDGHLWREEIFTELLTERFIFTSINAMTIHKDIAMVAPQNSLLPMTTYWGTNNYRVLALSKVLGVSRNEVKSLNFIAGTMFFTKIEILERLLHLDIEESDFEDECGQTDGTLAHAIERFLAVICYERDGRIITLGENRKKDSFKFASPTYE